MGLFSQKPDYHLMWDYKIRIETAETFDESTNLYREAKRHRALRDSELCLALLTSSWIRRSNEELMKFTTETQ